MPFRTDRAIDAEPVRAKDALRSRSTRSPSGAPPPSVRRAHSSWLEGVREDGLDHLTVPGSEVGAGKRLSARGRRGTAEPTPGVRRRPRSGDRPRGPSEVPGSTGGGPLGPKPPVRGRRGSQPLGAGASGGGARVSETRAASSAAERESRPTRRGRNVLGRGVNEGWRPSGAGRGCRRSRRSTGAPAAEPAGATRPARRRPRSRAARRRAS